MKLHSGGTNMTKVKVYVTLRESVVDPQGIATTDALKNMGFAEVESVRIGKLIELKIDETTTDIDARVKEMCDKLLINKVIEDYRYEIDLQKETVAFYDEMYFFKTSVFRKGENLTRRYIAYLKKIQNETVKDRFRSYSNQALIQRANSPPEFKWEDEGVELRQRSLQSNGAFIYTVRGNSLIILKDKNSEP